MKTSKEYTSKYKYYPTIPVEVVDSIIEQVQIDSYNEGIEDAAKNAQMIGYYSEPNKSEGITLKRFKRVWENRLFKVETNITIDKESILKLKK